MGSAVFVFLLMFFSVILQVFAGSYGFFVPCAAYATFYVAVTYGWRCGGMAAIAQGVCVDAIYMRSWFFSVAALLLITGLAQLWLVRADGKSLWAKVLPGLLIAVVCTLGPVGGNIVSGGGTPDEFLHELMSWLFTLMLSGGLLPLLIFLADDVAEHLGLQGFERAREKYIHRR